MGWKMSGGECCCCKDTIRMAEHHQWALSIFGGFSLFQKQRVKSPSKDIENVASINWRPSGGSAYQDGIGAVDRKNKNAWFTYGLRRRDSFGVVIGVDTYFCTWDASDNITNPAFEPGVVRDLFSLTDYHVYGMMADYDNERLIYTGVAYPDPWLEDPFANDVSHDFCSINFDGTGNTVHETIQLQRNGSTKGIPGIGGLILHRERHETYYVVVQNYTTASITDWVYEIRRRDLNDIGSDEVIYSADLKTGGGDLGSSNVRGITSLSIDIANGKLYWAEHWANSEPPSIRQRSTVKRSNLDGTGVETLYESVRPYRVNFVRYSNKLKKIIHQDFSDLPKTGGPLPGTWERNPDNWNDAKMVTLVDTPDNTYHGSAAAQLWCGYEITGPHAVC